MKSNVQSLSKINKLKKNIYHSNYDTSNKSSSNNDKFNNRNTIREKKREIERDKQIKN